MENGFDLLTYTESAVGRLRDIEVRISQPGVAGSREYAGLLREHGSLIKLVKLRQRILDLRRQVAEDEDMLESGDADMASLAEEELPGLREELENADAELEERLLLADDDSDRNAILEIRAGTGGEEAAIFAGDLMRMYSRYAENRGWKIELLSAHESEHDGYKEVVLSIQGDGVFQALCYEGGGHRVQRVPLTEAQGRIHTSAATVAVLPEVDEVDIEVNLNDLRIDTYSAGGPGGQHVNRTASAVRITHLPTGLVVQCQDGRSQLKNKAQAMMVLRSKLYEKAQEESDSKRSAARKAMIGSGDRSDRIRTYNFPQNRLTDHRAEITLYSLDRIMEGELDNLIVALREYDRRKRLEELAKDPSLLTRK